MRRSLQETEEFLERKRGSHHPTPREIVLALARNWRIVIIGMLMVTMTTVSFYFITAYTPTFGKEVLKLTSTDEPPGHPLRRHLQPVLAASHGRGVGPRWATAASAPVHRLDAGERLSGAVVAGGAALVSTPSRVELWFSFLYGSYNGAMIVALTEIIPVRLRTAGFSVAYSLATALFGGFTPAISTFLIEVTGNRAVAGLWLMFAAACGLAAALLAWRPGFAERQAPMATSRA